MSNRQQRRAAKKGKRPGQTYADVLAQKRMIKEAVERSVHDTNVTIESDIKAQRLLWISVTALNRAFGFGGERSPAVHGNRAGGCRRGRSAGHRTRC